MHTQLQGLHAPQFGLMRSAEAPEQLEARQPQAPAPTVIVRRRRVPEPAPPLEAAAGNCTPSSREPKTFRVAAAACANFDDPAVADKDDLAMAADPPQSSETRLGDKLPFDEFVPQHAPRKPRRRRADVEKPVLIQHLVFEHPVFSPAAADSAGVSEHTAVAEVLALEQSREAYRQVCEGLQRLKETVAQVEFGRAWSQDFDALMRRRAG